MVQDLQNIRTTTTEAPVSAPANNAPVWAEGQETYQVTDDKIELRLLASDADNDSLTYNVTSEGWGFANIEGGICC